jgi:hypothetical protein
MIFLTSAFLFTSAGFTFLCLIGPRMRAPGHVNFVLVVKQEPVKEEHHEPPLWVTLLIAGSIGAISYWPWLVYIFVPILILGTAFFLIDSLRLIIKRHLILTRKNLRKQNNINKHNNICQLQ